MKEGGEKKNILAKTLQRCRTSLAGAHRRRPPPPPAQAPDRSASCAAAGYFTVLVGPEKERFGVRARCANHPLFRALLDQAETEYGFAGCDGPLELPCAVDDFMEVMWEMEQGDPTASPGCGRFGAAGVRQLRRRRRQQQRAPPHAPGLRVPHGEPRQVPRRRPVVTTLRATRRPVRCRRRSQV